MSKNIILVKQYVQELITFIGIFLQHPGWRIAECL